MNKYLKISFWSLVVLFIGIVCMMAVSTFGDYLNVYFMLVAGLGLLILGILITVLTIKSKLQRSLRRFLLMTGISSLGIVVGVFLHNFIYGLFIYLFGLEFWNNIGIEDEPIFFILSVVVFPILILVGIIGTIVIMIKDKRQKHNHS